MNPRAPPPARGAGGEQHRGDGPPYGQQQDALEPGTRAEPLEARTTDEDAAVIAETDVVAEAPGEHLAATAHAGPSGRSSSGAAGAR
jgi:hypothetical protein